MILFVGCGQSGAPADVDPRLGDGIYVVDRAGGEPVRLAAVDGDGSAIKFGLLDHGDGTVEVAYVQDNDRNLYTVAATFDNGRVTTTAPQAKLVRSDAWALNGPAFCQARDSLAVGIWRNTAVGIGMIAADALRQLPPTPVEDALDQGALVPLQAADAQISTDLTCGNLDVGAAYCFLDCIGSASVEECLKRPGMSRIDRKNSLQLAAQRLTFPEEDSDVRDSPAPALVGDNGPAVFRSGDSSLHVMFERAYTNAISHADPEFRPSGFNKLMYKHIVGDPHDASEYEVDFSRWLPKPAPLRIVNSSSVRVLAQQGRPVVDFLALGVFKTPDPASGYDETVFMGIVGGQFDQSDASIPSNRILLDPVRVADVITFDRFTCYAWTTYGMSRDGHEVDMFALAYPQFFTLPDGTERVAFSAMRYRTATLADGLVTYSNGDTEPAERLYDRVCGRR